MRTPSEHRAAVAAWRETAPANDSEIFRYASTDKPRHSELSADLAALLQWRAMSRPPKEPLQTNWNVIPANDNRPQQDDYEGLEAVPEPALIECVHEIRPRENELMRAVKGVGFRERNGQFEPVDGDIERRDGAIVRLGRLEFGTVPTTADGTSTKPGNNRHLIKWNGRFPVDKFTQAKGADIDEDEELAKRKRLAGWLRCEPGKFIKKTPASRKANRARAERCRGKAMPPLPPIDMPLNAARAFAGLPPVDQNMRPVLPTGSIDIGNIFFGWMSKPKETKPGAAPRDDGDFDRDEIAAKLKPVDVAVLDAAMTASTMIAIGNVIGLTGKKAERRGKKALESACQNLSEILSAA